ncbi:hypothetical protein [Neomegalonema sp.]|uniref:hypothetical protein n=1 Tax=Neomegalonema sp. TaxID=2039713 RepID=UPI0026308F58|nr:hypothetical protein [Neomegalonema sp.]MDD2869683.1 hypothetical protein [Neomegalonema sp.]
MVYYDSARPSYSEEWHRTINPSASDCNGTGIIHATYTRTAIKAVFSPPNLIGNSIPGGKEFLETIGEINNDDLILWGAVKTASAILVTLKDRTEYVNKITKGGVDYSIRDVSTIAAGVGEVARLVRRT